MPPYTIPLDCLRKLLKLRNAHDDVVVLAKELREDPAWVWGFNAGFRGESQYGGKEAAAGWVCGRLCDNMLTQICGYNLVAVLINRDRLTWAARRLEQPPLWAVGLLDGFEDEEPISQSEPYVEGYNEGYSCLTKLKKEWPETIELSEEDQP